MDWDWDWDWLSSCEVMLRAPTVLITNMILINMITNMVLINMITNMTTVIITTMNQSTTKSGSNATWRALPLPESRPLLSQVLLMSSRQGESDNIDHVDNVDLVDNTDDVDNVDNVDHVDDVEIYFLNLQRYECIIYCQIYEC